MRQGFAGEALNLTPDLVMYMGRQAQQGRTDPRVMTSEDARIADAVGGLFGIRTMEYVPKRDGPPVMEILTPPGSADGQGVVELLAGDPSYNLGYPKIPGRNLEGIPNANDPVMREKLRQRLLKNPNGSEDLPGFLRGV